MVVEWTPVTSPAVIDIAGYQVLVVQEEPVLRVFSADLPATVTSEHLSATFDLPLDVRYQDGRFTARAA